MKRVIFLSFVLATFFINLSVYAQNDFSTQTDVYEVVEEMPEFPGGNEELFKFIQENIKYPEEAYVQEIEGKVFVTFVIDKNGKAGQAEILRSTNPLLDEETLRVVSIMPEWNPGKQDGENVNVQYTIPVEYVLEHKN